MITQQNIHHSALLKPQKCKYLLQNGQHAYILIKQKNYEQCIDCGKIKREYYGLRTR